MGEYLITGRQGSGKTSVIREIQKRGFTAYNTDDLREVTKLQDKETGELIEWPEEGKVDWTRYAWNWQRPEIERLLASDETVFLGAIVSNQKDFLPLFDKVFILTVDADTLRKRLSNHEHESHHQQGEIERIVADHESKQARMLGENREAIDGTRPIDEIVDDILQRTGLS